MVHWRWWDRLVVIGLLAAIPTVAQAGRTPMTRTAGQKSSGARNDIRVPYLTNGASSFGAYSVAPKIYGSPRVDDPKNPQSRPVYNLIFYGSTQGFGDKSNGATPKPK